MYYIGQGVPKDYAEAVKWWQLAAQRNLPIAQHFLAVMYAKGQGVPQSHAEAAKWYLLAAERGHAESQLALGKMYQNGRGLPRSRIQAHKWFNLAAALFPPGEARAAAVQRRDRLAGRMSAKQLFEAQRLARQWQPK